MSAARFIVSLCGGIAVAGGVAACNSDRTPASPLKPSAQPGQATGLTIEGPGTVAPGQTAQFRAVARLAEGGTRDVTAEAVWFSSAGLVLSIANTGAAAGRGVGETHLSANFANLRTTREVIVVPEGTFRLGGIVTESDTSDASLGGAVVAVTAGAVSGLSAITAPNGHYALYGVTGETRVQVTKEGYQTRVETIITTDHRTENFALRLVDPRQNVAGTYTLVIAAADSCRSKLPEELRTRTYAAHVTQNGPHVEVRLSGATFAVSPMGRGDRFRGRAEPGGLSFFLNAHVYQYYGYAAYPDIAEKLQDSRYIVIDGSVTASGTPARFAGVLDGAYQVFGYDPAWGGTATVECRGGHEFALTRTDGR